MNKRSLLIVHCSTLGASETFIQSHIKHLPFQTFFAHQLPPQLLDISHYTAGEGASVDALQDHTESYLQILDEVKPAMVLAEYGPSGVAVLEACKMRSIPLVVHFHGFDCSMHNVLDHYKKSYQEMFEYCSSIVVVSREMEQKLLSLNAPCDKLVCIPYGVDLKRFPVTSPSFSKRILFIGRLVEKKSPTLLIEAFSEALQTIPELRLRIVGDGPLLSACQDTIQRLDIASSVSLLGQIDHNEVARLLQECDFLVCPSMSARSGDEEGLPNCILEAFASGRPVIGTAHAGIPDAVIHEETGLLVPPGDTIALAENIVRLATDHELLTRLGQSARAFVEAHHSLDQQIQKLSGLLVKHGDTTQV